MRPLIALLTDFGTRDSYVAQMKGVLLSRCNAELVDLSHEIPAFDVVAAAFFLQECVPMFPAEPERAVIFVAVVDPGVGSARRILAARQDGRMFLAPDNGLLSLVLREDALVHSVEDTTLFLPSVSGTFHGRDRFAPAAAALAGGKALRDLGPPLDATAVHRIDYTPPTITPESAVGSIVSIDHFGNLITDIDPAGLGELAQLEAKVNGVVVADHADNYAAKAGTSEPFLIIGSRGTIEISLSGASAADLLQSRRLQRVTISRRA